MKEQPKNIELCTIEVIVMPNGEVICLGKRIGWFRDLKHILKRKYQA